MPIEPKFQKNKGLLEIFQEEEDTKKFERKVCSQCGRPLLKSEYAATHSLFFSDKLLPVCNSCITEWLRAKDFSWEFINKVCQWADIPFIVKEWERIFELSGEAQVWTTYSKVFADKCYEELGWDHYNKQYITLREKGLIEEEIPLVREKKYTTLRKKWGANYDEEQLNYLEDLFKGLCTTQNVNGALQMDQAQKICKLSLEIDSRIRSGDKEVDKFMSSYEKAIKIAEFTPKNSKNASDFDSFAEIAYWLEKRGKQNRFYDGTTRDIIDETLKNIENYNQKLYINESGIGDEITQRLEALKTADTQENYYNIQQEYDLDEYDNMGYNFETSEDFEVTGEEEII